MGQLPLAASDAKWHTNTDPYTFAWTLNGQPIGAVLPTPPVQADATPEQRNYQGAGRSLHYYW